MTSGGCTGIMRRLRLSIFVLLIVAVGCGVSVHSYVPPPPTYERISLRSYELNDTSRVFVGEALVRVKDYTERVRRASALTPMTNVHLTLSGLGSRSTLIAGAEYPIVGSRQSGGQAYRVVRTESGLFILVSHDGRILEGTALNAMQGGGYVPLVYRLSTDPSPAHMNDVLVRDIVTDSSFINFEIIYTGRTGDSLTFSYREYTRADLARPAYYQELTYPANSEFIRHKSLRIRVVEATNEAITYVVVEDGNG